MGRSQRFQVCNMVTATICRSKGFKIYLISAADVVYGQFISYIHTL